MTDDDDNDDDDESLDEQLSSENENEDENDDENDEQQSDDNVEEVKTVVPEINYAKLSKNRLNNLHKKRDLLGIIN